MREIITEIHLSRVFQLNKKSSIEKNLLSLKHYKALSNIKTEIKCLKDLSPYDPKTKWTKTIKLQDLPIGERKEIQKEGLNLLLFWYKGDVYAIDPRSPAEGAYSEGFLKATFTQDYCIKCPSTGTLFSLKTGDIVEWYPNNPVLRFLTPKEYCRPLNVYPVLIDQETIFVDITTGTTKNAKGGAGTSMEENNIYGIEPKVYLEGTNPDDDLKNPDKIVKNRTENVVTSPSTLIGFGLVSTGGTALLLYYENFTALIIFWIILFSIFAFYAYNSVMKNE